MTVTYLHNRDGTPRKPKPSEANHRATEAWIDQVGHEGLIEGWARGFAHARPVELLFRLDGVQVGSACAASFRKDLLVAEIGHGHYGFRCQIRAGVALRGKLQVREAGSELVLAELQLAVAGHAVAGAARARSVESLLSRSTHWTMADVGIGIEALELEENRSRWGDRRFIAMVYKFLLGRWPCPTDYEFFRRELRRGAMSAVGVFTTIFDGEERKNNGIAPTSPYDGRFPFRLSSERPIAADAGSIASLATYYHEANTDYLAEATLMTGQWDDASPQLQYDEPLKRLLCHPPAEGVAVAKIEGFSVTGQSHLRVRASVDHALSQPVEFAMLLARADAGEDELLARFQGIAEDTIKWYRVAGGAYRLLEADCEAGPGPAKLYIGTRMAAGAPNHSFAWAHFSDLVHAAAEAFPELAWTG